MRRGESDDHTFSILAMVSRLLLLDCSIAQEHKGTK
jgi:hypothetical protein